MKQFGILMH